MKTIQNKIAILFISFFALSCSSDDDNSPSFADENPLEAYVTQTGFSENQDYVDNGDYEFGLAFSPNVAGVMKAITVKLPDANANLRVTIWDYDTQTVLRSETVNVTTADVSTTKAIAHLTLVKDKKYVISMNSDDWYHRTKPDNTNATYPVTAGNIKYWEYRWGGGTTQTFPLTISSNYYAGDLSFVFQQTE